MDIYNPFGARFQSSIVGIQEKVFEFMKVVRDELITVSNGTFSSLPKASLPEGA